jgi:hypothetical protein
VLPLALPLGVAVEPLGCEALLEPLSLEELELLLGVDVEPPEDVPLLSFSLSVEAELDELDGGVLADGLVVELDEELGELGLVALGELELELEPALGELDGGVDGDVDDALLLEPGAGALEVFPDSFLLQAASPKASATAIANVEILMCSSKLDTNKEASNVRTGCKPLIKKGAHPALRTLCLSL